MLPPDAFGEYGVRCIRNKDYPVDPDGKHPEDWKGHFVLVMNDLAFPNGERRQYHRCVFRSSFKNWIGSFTCDYRKSFNPTVFMTREDALGALEMFVRHKSETWENMFVPNDGNILGITRECWHNGDRDVIDPLFEILDACDYRIERLTVIMGYGDKLGIVKRPECAEHVPERSEDVAEPVVKKPDPWIESVKTTSVTFASKVSPERKPKARAKAMADAMLRFIAQDSKSGLYLSIPTGSSFREATLVKLDDATYFPTLDSMLGVLNAIEHSFWIADFQRWHLVGRTAMIENDRVVNMRNI